MEDKMANVIEIDNELYKALVESFGQEVPETQLEKYTGEILNFEKKYGTSFNEFEKMWDEGRIENKHSYEIEGDFMDWEMMEMEKKDLLTDKIITDTKKYYEIDKNER
jgi:hypothetical protein